jgi:hypothetical protein
MAVIPSTRSYRTPSPKMLSLLFFLLSRYTKNALSLGSRMNFSPTKHYIYAQSKDHTKLSEMLEDTAKQHRSRSRSPKVSN